MEVIIFIDGSNLYHDLVKNFGKANLDFVKFADLLVAKNRLVKVYYYNAPLNQRAEPVAYRKQQKFFSYIQKLPKFELKLGRLEKRSNGSSVEKGVDVKMAVDIVTQAYSDVYDVGIIVSGDADFVPVIKAAQDFGNKMINVRFPKTKCFHLNQVCNETKLIEKEEFAKLYWNKK